MRKQASFSIKIAQKEEIVKLSECKIKRKKRIRKQVQKYKIRKNVGEKQANS